MNVNGAGQVIPIDGLDVDGVLYNLTSFDGTGTAFFCPDSVAANTAGEAGRC